MTETNTQERTRHKVKNREDVSKLLGEYKIDSGDIIEFEGGERRLVKKVCADDTVETIYKDTNYRNAISVSGFSPRVTGEWFLGRYYPGHKEFRFKLTPSDDFDKYKSMLEQAGLWNN